MCLLVATVASLVTAAAPTSAAPLRVYTGRIVDERTGRPIEGVLVRASIPLFPGSPRVTPFDRTDSSGDFRIVVPDGKARVLYVDERLRDYEIGWVSEPSGFETTRTIRLPGEPPRYNPGDLGTITMERKVWSGRLIDTRTGRPIEGLGVHLRLANGQALSGSAIPHFEGVPHPAIDDVTDEQGRFRLAQEADLDNGALWRSRYRVCVNAATDEQAESPVFEYGCVSAESGRYGLLVDADATTAFRAGRLGAIQVARVAAQPD